MGTADQTDHVAVKAATERPAVFPDLQPPAGRREAVAGCYDILHAAPACDGTYYGVVGAHPLTHRGPRGAVAPSESLTQRPNGRLPRPPHGVSTYLDHISGLRRDRILENAA